MHAVVGDFFDIGEVMAVTQIRMQDLAGRLMCRCGHPNIVCLCHCAQSQQS